MLPPTPSSKTRRTRRAVSAVLVLAASGVLTCLSAVLPAPAFASRFDSAVPGDLVDVEVLVDGHATPLFRAPDRFDRLYFQATRGRHYSLAIHNNTGERVGVLIAVDGLNVVNGEKSDLSRSEPMYVLDPYERAEIRGWRTSLREVRKFVFVDEDRSYAERSGQANGDMGWVRVLAFREVGRAPAWQPWLRDEEGRLEGRRGAAPGTDAPDRAQKSAPGGAGSTRPEGGPASGGTPVPQSARGEANPPALGRESSDSYQGVLGNANPGTGWGERSRDVVSRTWFEPEAVPADHIVLRYEYESGLRALGIDPRGYRDRLWEREHGDFGFAQPPKW